MRRVTLKSDTKTDMSIVSGRTGRGKLIIVFLVDMDDTLLENDRIEDLRALQRYRVERLNNTHLLSMSRYRADYLFDHPYRGTLDVL